MDKIPVEVLLVEDNPDDADLMRETLTESTPSTFQLTHVERLSEALKRLGQRHFDVALLDLSLPDSKGLETFSRLHSQIPEIPIVVLTGLDDEALASRAMQRGAQDYLIKGQADNGVLVRAIRYAIERQRLRLELVQHMNEVQFSEARLRHIIERNSDGVIIMDRNGIVRFVNPAAEALLSRSKEQLLDEVFGFPVGEATTELDVLRRDGETAVAEMRVVETEWNGEAAYLASLRDITERKRAEAVLQESEERFRKIFDHSNDAIFVIDPELDRILDANSRACDLLEYAQEDLLSIPISAIHPHEMSKFRAFAQSVFERGTGWTDECTCRTKSGRELPAEISASTMDRDGRACMIAMVRDITERRRRQAEERMLHRVREEVWKMTHAKEIVQVLMAVREGLDALPVLPQHYAINVIDESSDPPTVSSHEMTREGNWRMRDDSTARNVVVQIWRTDVPAYRRDLAKEDPYHEYGDVAEAWYPEVRSVLDVPFSHGTLSANSPEPEAFTDRDLAFMQELTDVLSVGFRRLDDLNALALKEQQLRQAQKVEMIDQLAAGIAHEINNPLTTITGLCQLLLDDSLEEGMQQDIDQIYQAGSRAAEITRRLLTFARRQKLEKQAMDLNEVVREALALMRRLLQLNHIELTESFDEDLPRLHVHAGQIQQVVLNLVQNSQDALRESVEKEKRITVRTCVCADKVVLAVEDSGPGVPEQIRERVFEPFFTTKEIGSGSGLGLSVCNGIMQDHGGHLRLESQPTGARFVIELPIEKQTAEASSNNSQ